MKEFIDDADCYERRDTIVLSGSSIPSFTTGEKCSEIVKNVVKRELKIVIGDADINTAHRLWRKPVSQGVDRRGIVVKLCRRDLKRDLIMASKQQGKSSRSSNLYINESLTPTRQKLLFALRQIKRAHPTLVSGCTSIEGRVFAFTKNKNAGAGRDMRHLINTQDALQKFCDEFVKLPLENFLLSSSA